MDIQLRQAGAGSSSIRHLRSTHGALLACGRRAIIGVRGNRRIAPPRLLLRRLELERDIQAPGNRLAIALCRMEAPATHRFHCGAVQIA